jgi:hypothetical protein
MLHLLNILMRKEEKIRGIAKLGNTFFEENPGAAS